MGKKIDYHKPSVHNRLLIPSLTAPKTCMDLVLRAERVYNLLGSPHNVNTADQIAVIIKQLPPATASAIQIAALTNKALTRTYGELKKFISLMDEQFKT